jgi:hypothetical protein
MTTSTEKAHLGIAALYTKFASVPYASTQHWNTHRAFRVDPTLDQVSAAFVPNTLLIQINCQFIVDTALVT